MSQSDLKDASFDNRVKSIKTCEIKFDTSCRQCPKIFQKYSLEYNFWATLFSIYSRTFREEFEARVQRSYDGFISWDFLFPSKAKAGTFGDQYQDVLENHLRLFRVLRTTRPGQFGFTSENVQTLSALAANVRKERKEQWMNMLKDGQNERLSFIVLFYLEKVWNSLDNTLSDISRSWNLENNRGDACGLVEGEEEPEELADTETLVNDGATATYGDDPWHVGIYQLVKGGDDPILLCGGTLISPTVVVSAAHCFYDAALKVRYNDSSTYEIAVGKYRRDYLTNDGSSQRIHKIAELIFNPKAYNPGGTKTHGADIILIILEEPIAIDSFVRPICLDWDGRIFSSLLDNAAMGRIVGWGSVANDPRVSDPSDYLRKADLVYISHDNCVGKTAHLNIDNFCGGSPKGENGAGPRKGDSGGGFVFKYKDRYYLRGIVSTRDSNKISSISAFTDLAEYIPWIRNYV